MLCYVMLSYLILRYLFFPLQVFFSHFMWVAILKLLLFGVFEMRTIIIVYQARYYSLHTAHELRMTDTGQEVLSHDAQSPITVELQMCLLLHATTDCTFS
jgi:hypothetical protein